MDMIPQTEFAQDLCRYIGDQVVEKEINTDDEFVACYAVYLLSEHHMKREHSEEYIQRVKDRINEWFMEWKESMK